MVFEPQVIEVDTEERQAIARLKRGEMGALALLVERYQGKAIRAAYLITQDLRQAEDVVQETFLRVYHHIDQFDERRRFEPWFMRSVVNAAIKSTERDRRSVSIDDGPDDLTLGDWLAGGEPTIDEQVEAGELKERVRSAMQQLSPRMRAAVVQRYYLELSEKQMSEAFNSPPGTIKWLLNAARKQLRALLDPERMSDL